MEDGRSFAVSSINTLASFSEPTSIGAANPIPGGAMQAAIALFYCPGASRNYSGSVPSKRMSCPT